MCNLSQGIREEERTNIILTMLKNGFSVEQIALAICSTENQRCGSYCCRKGSFECLSNYKYHSVVILAHICYTMSVVLFYKEEF